MFIYMRISSQREYVIYEVDAVDAVDAVDDVKKNKNGGATTNHYTA